MSASIGDFAHAHWNARPAASSRAAALALTALLFGAFAFLFSQRAFWRIADQAALRETVTLLLPDAPPPARHAPRLPPVIAHLLRPHSESVALPTYTVAADAPAPHATLPVTAVSASPLKDGAQAGSGTQALSGTGAGGSGAVAAGCYDAAWAQAATDRVARFFYYPAINGRRVAATGVAFVHMVVERDGLLLKSAISKTSHSRILDIAAVDIVRRAHSLPAFTPRMHADRIEVELPVNFGTDEQLTPSAGDCD